jgi:hypothetical protein
LVPRPRLRKQSAASGLISTILSTCTSAGAGFGRKSSPKAAAATALAEAASKPAVAKWICYSRRRNSLFRPIEHRTERELISFLSFSYQFVG